MLQKRMKKIRTEEAVGFGSLIKCTFSRVMEGKMDAQDEK